jgi:hypothetical protein
MILVFFLFFTDGKGFKETVRVALKITVKFSLKKRNMVHFGNPIGGYCVNKIWFRVMFQANSHEEESLFAMVNGAGYERSQRGFRIFFFASPHHT